MKLNQFIKALQALKAEHGNLEVVYSIDEEGNGFEDVFYAPSVMSAENLAGYRGNETDKVICIN